MILNISPLFIEYPPRTLLKMKEWLKYRGKGVGWLKKGEFWTKRTSDHYFRKFGGYGLSVAVLRVLDERDVVNINAILDNGNILRCNLDDFIYKADFWTDGKDDKQMVLNLKFWKPKIVDERQAKL